jgi:hypothetical protein
MRRWRISDQATMAAATFVAGLVAVTLAAPAIQGRVVPASTMLLSSAALSTNRPPATASFGFPEFSFRTPVSAATTFSYAAPTTVAPAAAPVAAAGNRYNFGRFFFPAASQQYFGQQQPQYRAIVDYNIRELQPHTLKVHQQHEQQLRVLQKQQQQQLRPQPQFRQHYQQQLRPQSLLKQQQQQRQLTVNIRARQPFSERLPNPAFYRQQQNMFAEERSAIDSNSLDLDYAGVDGDDDLALATGRGFYIPPGEFSIFDAVPY